MPRATEHDTITTYVPSPTDTTEQPTRQWSCFTDCSLAPDAPPCPCMSAGEART